MNEIYNNYTRSGGKFEAINYENVAFSATVFIASLMNFKAPGTSNPKDRKSVV